ncbi:MAG: hypothetical protein RL014_41 [Pseudomonadota bacterium]|jgi:tetratricopeptide (TPR) repeat protein
MNVHWRLFVHATRLAALLSCVAVATAASAVDSPADSARKQRHAQAPAASEVDADLQRAVPPARSAMDARLFYQLLLGELNARSDEPGAGYSLILDAARKTNDPALFRRAVEIALSARSGEAALQGARAWRQAHPESLEAHRYLLQIMVALNRLEDSVEVLRSMLTLSRGDDRQALIVSLPRQFSRAADKALAARVVEQGLSPVISAAGRVASTPAHVALAWTAVGRTRLAAGSTEGALQAAQRATDADPNAEVPVLLALELFEARQREAEPLVLRHLDARGAQARTDIRMAYARALIDLDRPADAATQIGVVTAASPELPEPWLIQGSLQLQQARPAEAEASLKRFLELSDGPARGNTAPAEERSRSRAQAFVMLAQIAEQRRDFAAANAWLDRIDNPQDLLSAQVRRASILARQGRLDDALALIARLPQRSEAESRARLLAEVQLLRDHGRAAQAHLRLREAVDQQPRDTDLMYELAMAAEKIGRLDEMEDVLRKLIAIKPDFHHAYNALGYSLADRNVRLPEARALIVKALEFVPGDPFITDSLGWLEYRMGNLPEAARLLEQAYKTRPDAEIAAHLGEVLWVMGSRERARRIWQEGQLLNAENETLRATLKRFGVRP